MSTAPTATLPTVGSVLTAQILAKSVITGADLPFENVFVEIDDPALATVEWDGLVRVTPLGPLGHGLVHVRIDLKIGGGEVLQHVYLPIDFVEPADVTLVVAIEPAPE